MAQINKPTDYFNTVLYTGNGTDNTAITGVGFQTDFLWIKERSSTSFHNLQDVVRGATKQLLSSETNAEETSTSKVKSFDSDGFTLGTSGAVNQNSQTYVSWNWLAGGSASSNTDGSITSSVSANTTAGFSIVTWTAPATGSNTDTIGHGLSAVPKMIIAKTRSNVDGWRVYHHVPGIDKHGSLNNTNAFNSNTNIFPTLPTTSFFYPGSDASINSSSRTYVAYCFAEKKGYSKFGSYTGNNSNDGTFVYTGFKPAWVMVKRTDSTLVANWSMFDNKRSSYNIERSQLEANTSDAQQTDASADIDLLSNGFKLRSTADENNDGGGNYIFMAFAENPLVGTNNIPATAR